MLFKKFKFIKKNNKRGKKIDVEYHSLKIKEITQKYKNPIQTIYIPGNNISYPPILNFFIHWGKGCCRLINTYAHVDYHEWAVMDNIAMRGTPVEKRDEYFKKFREYSIESFKMNAINIPLKTRDKFKYSIPENMNDFNDIMQVITETSILEWEAGEDFYTDDKYDDKYLVSTEIFTTYEINEDEVPDLINQLREILDYYNTLPSLHKKLDVDLI